jgi:hypothetical protein
VSHNIRRRSTEEKVKSWATRKLNWLDKVVLRPELRGLPFSVAGRLVTKYLNLPKQ